MANCNDLFTDFHKEISLSATQENLLRTSRDAVADTIKEFFKGKNIKVPSFCQQGSYAMRTIINPADEKNGRYDIDYGVYLEELPSCDGEEAKIKKAKEWIMEAVADQTDIPPDNKKKCVRVYYKAKYNIDLPIYKEENGKTYIGTRDSGWEESDPAVFTDWFVNKVSEKGERMRRVVKYLKAAVDNSGVKFKSIAITIAVANMFVDIENRDDKSFSDTLANVVNHIRIYRSIQKPVIPYENILQNSTSNDIDKLLSGLDSILKNAMEAIETNDRVEASKKWRKIFGDRFTECTKNFSASNGSVTIVQPDSPKPWRR